MQLYSLRRLRQGFGTWRRRSLVVAAASESAMLFLLPLISCLKSCNNKIRRFSLSGHTMSTYSLLTGSRHQPWKTRPSKLFRLLPFLTPQPGTARARLSGLQCVNSGNHNLGGNSLESLLDHVSCTVFTLKKCGRCGSVTTALKIKLTGVQTEPHLGLSESWSCLESAVAMPSRWRREQNIYTIYKP